MLSLGKFSRYFIWFGISILVTGLVVAMAVQSEPIAASLFLAFGLLLLITGVVVNVRTQTLLADFLTRRSTQTGLNGLLSAIALVVILCFVNVLAAQFPVRIDLTETQIHTLAPQTKETIKALDQPLNLWLFQESDDAEMTPLLEDYQRLNPSKFKYAFVDPDRDVSLIQRFNVQTRGEVHLEYGGKTQLVQVLAAGEPLNEAQLTNSIIRMRGDRQPHIYLLQGHGEPPLDGSEGGLMQMGQALETQGYRVTPLNLAQNPTLPEDASVIAIIAPKTPLLSGEIELLKTHLQQNKSLLILLDPQTKPQLDPILQDWGIALDQRLLIDEDQRSEFLGLGESTLLISNYGDHPITAALENQISVYQFARPIKLTPKPAIAASAILTTDDRIWAENDPQNPNPTFKAGQDLRGPLDFGIALQRSFTKEAEAPETFQTEARLVIIGNATFATNGWFEQYFNGDLLLNSVNWLAQAENAPLAIRPKEPQNRRLNLSGWQIALVAWLAPIIFPLGGLVGAGLLLWRRR